MSVMNSLPRTANLPGVRRVVLRPEVRRRIAGALAVRFWAAAWCTTSPWTVLRREFLRSEDTHLYTLRRSGLPIAIKHGRDMEAIFEIFVRGEYEPPAALRQRLSQVSTVVDIGANVGAYSAWALGQWPAATVIAVEPVPENLAVYETWVESAQGNLDLIRAAAGTSAGTAQFVQGRGGGDRRATDAEVHDPRRATNEGLVTVQTIDILPIMARADVIKMDIEGGEWPILADPRMAQLSCVTLVMEFHRHGAPYLPAVDAARELLSRAGFSTGFARCNYWGHGILWAWKD